MALFKIHKGAEKNSDGTSRLPSSYVEGYAYFATDTGRFYIDTANTASGRKMINPDAVVDLSYDGSKLKLTKANGTSTTSANFYAPTSAGIAGQILQSNGSGAPTWTSIIAGNFGVNTQTGASAFYINRSSDSFDNEERTKIYQDDNTLYFDMINDETSCRTLFSYAATDTENSDGSKAVSGSVSLGLNSNGKTYISANLIEGSLNWSNITSKPSYYDAKAIKSISRSGTTFTYTCLDGTTGTFTQQDNNTTYSAGTGISLSGTTFSNSGVRSIATGSSNGTISVNTNGKSANVAVKGLGSAAYKNASGTWGINITGSSASCTGNASTATKLATARSISLGNQLSGSASFDGSANVTISAALKYCTVDGNGTSKFPYHRIAYGIPGTGAYVDSYAIFLISANYSGGAWGIVKIGHRTNSSGDSVSYSAEWLVRSGNMPVDAITVASYGKSVTNSVYFDVFYHVNGSSWPRTTVTALGPVSNVTLVNSIENSSTSATEAYASIAAAGTALHGKAYTSSGTSTQTAIYGAVWN